LPKRVLPLDLVHLKKFCYGRWTFGKAAVTYAPSFVDEQRKTLRCGFAGVAQLYFDAYTSIGTEGYAGLDDADVRRLRVMLAGMVVWFRLLHGNLALQESVVTHDEAIAIENVVKNKVEETLQDALQDAVQDEVVAMGAAAAKKKEDRGEKRKADDVV
jgi:hypothetical protein